MLNVGTDKAREQVAWPGSLKSVEWMQNVRKLKPSLACAVLSGVDTVMIVVFPSYVFESP